MAYNSNLGDRLGTWGQTGRTRFSVSHQYTALPGCTPTYDGDGNLTKDCTNT